MVVLVAVCSLGSDSLVTLWLSLVANSVVVIISLLVVFIVVCLLLFGWMLVGIGGLIVHVCYILDLLDSGC